MTQQQRAGEAVKVLYVGGVPRSGSTLTDLMLDGLPGHVAVGELFYLWTNGALMDNLCSCGQTFHLCPFWTEVGDVAYGGWDRVDASDVVAMQDEVDRTAKIPALLTGRGGDAYRRRLEDYRAVLLPLYRAIATVSGKDVVVDSSKRPSLAYLLSRTAGVDLTVAHVLRDPRGVAHSFAKVVRLPSGASSGDIMPRSRMRKVARRWVTVNGAISALRLLGVPVVQVRYEDLVRRPVQELQRIAAAEGVPTSAADFDFLDGSSLTLPSTHVVAGGRIRLGGGSMALRLDEAWRSDMPRRTRWAVGAATAPARLLYGYR